MSASATQGGDKLQKPRFGCLLQLLAWKWSGIFSKNIISKETSWYGRLFGKIDVPKIGGLCPFSGWGEPI